MTQEPAPTPPDHDLLDLASDAPGVWEDAGVRLLERGAAAVPLLVRGLDDDRLGSVAHGRILFVLGRLAREETLPVIRRALHRALTRGDASVASGALEALAAFDTPDSMSELVALLDYADPDIVKRAAVLVGQVGGAQATEPLSRLLRSGDPGIRYSAVQGLLEAEDPAARDVLRQHLSRETDPETRALIASAVQPH